MEKAEADLLTGIVNTECDRLMKSMDQLLQSSAFGNFTRRVVTDEETGQSRQDEVPISVTETSTADLQAAEVLHELQGSTAVSNIVCDFSIR